MANANAGDQVLARAYAAASDASDSASGTDSEDEGQRPKARRRQAAGRLVPFCKMCKYAASNMADLIRHISSVDHKLEVSDDECTQHLWELGLCQLQ